MSIIVSLPVAICQLCKVCYEKNLEVKRFRDDCRKLAMFVQRIEGFVMELEDDADPSEPGWQAAYLALHESLEDCSALMHECAKYGRIRSLINSDDMAHRFNSVTQRLNLALSMLPIQKMKTNEIRMEAMKGLQQDMRRAQYTALQAAEEQSADLKKLMDMAKGDSSKTHEMLEQLLGILATNGHVDPKDVTAEVADLREELLRARALKNKVEEDYLHQIIQAIGGVYSTSATPTPTPKQMEGGMPPSELLCPITIQVMQDPVIVAESGQTYERAGIEEWLARGHKLDPLTGVTLTSCTLVPNVLARKMVADWLAKNPDFPMPDLGSTTISRAAMAATSPATKGQAKPLHQPTHGSLGDRGTTSTSTMRKSVCQLSIEEQEEEQEAEPSAPDAEAVFEAERLQRERAAAASWAESAEVDELAVDTLERRSNPSMRSSMNGSSVRSARAPVTNSGRAQGGSSAFGEGELLTLQDLAGPFSSVRVSHATMAQRHLSRKERESEAERAARFLGGNRGVGAGAASASGARSTESFSSRNDSYGSMGSMEGRSEAHDKMDRGSSATFPSDTQAYGRSASSASSGQAQPPSAAPGYADAPSSSDRVGGGRAYSSSHAQTFAAGTSAAADPPQEVRRVHSSNDADVPKNARRVGGSSGGGSRGAGSGSRDETASVGSSEGGSSTKSGRSLKQGMKSLFKSTKYMFAYDDDKM